jgi:hypothetical protein
METRTVADPTIGDYEELVASWRLALRAKNKSPSTLVTYRLLAMTKGRGFATSSGSCV